MANKKVDNTGKVPVSREMARMVNRITIVCHSGPERLYDIPFTDLVAAMRQCINDGLGEVAEEIAVEMVRRAGGGRSSTMST